MNASSLIIDRHDLGFFGMNILGREDAMGDLHSSLRSCDQNTPVDELSSSFARLVGVSALGASFFSSAVRGILKDGGLGWTHWTVGSK